jgi:hypothetical protein
VRERPILFSGPMVRAILEGRKHQTRRIVRVRKPTDHLVLASPYATSLCPYGQPGDRLWVRETWGPCAGGVVYRASEDGAACPDGGKWKPSIFMPRWASRITLEVTDVRVERLQDISEEDIAAEGIPLKRSQLTGGLGVPGDWLADERGLDDSFRGDLINAKSAWQLLWDSINADRASWASNPWVWVVEFKRTEAA